MQPGCLETVLAHADVPGLVCIRRSVALEFPTTQIVAVRATARSFLRSSLHLLGSGSGRFDVDPTRTSGAKPSRLRETGAKSVS